MKEFMEESRSVASLRRASSPASGSDDKGTNSLAAPPGGRDGGGGEWPAARPCPECGSPFGFVSHRDRETIHCRECISPPRSAIAEFVRVVGACESEWEWETYSLADLLASESADNLTAGEGERESGSLAADIPPDEVGADEWFDLLRDRTEAILSFDRDHYNQHWNPRRRK